MFAFLRHSARPALRRRLALILCPLLMAVGLISSPAHADESVDAETVAAINITMDYWATAMPGQFNLQWVPPGLFDAGYGYNSLYDGGTSDFYCGTTRLERDNAYACESAVDNWVAFDVTFMNRSQTRPSSLTRAPRVERPSMIHRRQ